MTRQEMADLLRQWRDDPCWDLSDSGDTAPRTDALHAYQAQVARIDRAVVAVERLQTLIDQRRRELADLEMLAELAGVGLDAEVDALGDKRTEVLRLYPDDDREPA